MTVSPSDFPPCPICDTSDWLPIHGGNIRDGAFGTWREAEVRRCHGCGVDRLAESACLASDAYQSPEYRSNLLQDGTLDNFFSVHDELTRFTLEAIWPRSLRGRTIADVGCGGGSVLDSLKGVAGTLIAIDPAEAFADSLAERGYDWFAGSSAAIARHAGMVDVAFSIQVIEHVTDPRAFLREISCLLRPDGYAVISTPNRRDILMDLLPEAFPSFFYRTQHRWAFDVDSLAQCADRAGLSVVEVRYIHRYGIANAMHWLKERRPRGRTPMIPFDGMIDRMWQSWLEATGRSDCLYMILKPAPCRAVSL